MNAGQEYVRQVMDRVPPAHPERERIELDLRAHVEETLEAVEGSSRAAIERLGAPGDVAAAYVAESPMRFASVGSRVLAFLVDVALGFVVFGAIALSAVLLFGVLAATEEAYQSGPPDVTFALMVVPAILFVLTMMALSIAYFPVLEWRYGQTLGKYLLGIHVVADDGLRATLPATIVRRIPFFFEFFWVDAIVALFTERKQRAFDLVARTLVLETR